MPGSESESKGGTRFTFFIYEGYLKIIKWFVDKGQYPSVSEVLRQAVEKWIQSKLENSDKIDALLTKIRQMELAAKNDEKKIREEDDFLSEIL